MLDTKLSQTGTVLMHGEHIYLDGFSADSCMCREVAVLALIWAIGEMQCELSALIEQPGGSGKTCIDLPIGVEQALGLTDQFTPNPTE